MQRLCGSPTGGSLAIKDLEMRAMGWRRKTAVALLLQVTPDSPNSAEYEADRHRD